MSNEIKFLPASYYRDGQLAMGRNRVGEIWQIDPKYICLKGLAFSFRISEIKPILRRLESMSDQEKFIFGSYHSPIYQDGRMYANSEAFDWLDVNGFDRPRLIDGVRYESLIDAGLAIDAATLETK